MIIQTPVLLIENCNDTLRAEFVADDEGNRLVFNTHEEAEEWLNEYGNPDIYYRHYVPDGPPGIGGRNPFL